MTNALIPLTPPYSPNIQAILDQYPQQNGYLLSLFRTFANSERFLRKGVPNLLDRESPLDLRTREIIILRVTANHGCEYEWGVHVAIFSKAAKLTEAEIAATCDPRRTGWAPREQRLIAAVDQFCKNAGLNAHSLTQFQEDWRTEEQLEIIALCGAYTTVSLVANVARLPPEAFAAKFPKK